MYTKHTRCHNICAQVVENSVNQQDIKLFIFKMVKVGTLAKVFKSIVLTLKNKQIEETHTKNKTVHNRNDIKLDLNTHDGISSSTALE